MDLDTDRSDADLAPSLFPLSPPDSPACDAESCAISRRGLLIAGAGASAAVAAGTPLDAAAQATSPSAVAGPQPQENLVATSRVTLSVNGQPHTLVVDNRTSLLDLLREHLQLTGTKKGCDHGQCGACTIHLDGRRVNACLTLAVMHEGAKVVTIEGLGTPEKMHAMQSAFVRHDGYQCGYCTPGQICSAVAVLDEIKAGMPSHVTPDLNVRPLLSIDELRERMSGNLCRCGAYSNIIDAMAEVAGVPVPGAGDRRSA
ncbi:aldehyde dehydrogenase iron-sulfur subunit PaoA [Roseateles chitinivorans]|uniref:aldehyde dehydrogenase iron-sulfur subunit PaoA n=1 Tax=Roseateles chitinivorans TaxID=2917965 RepID=UPI003D674B63